MSKTKTVIPMLTLLIVVALWPAPAAATPQNEFVLQSADDCDDGECAEHKIVIRKRVCDGEECDESPEMVFFSDSGERVEIDGDGNTWVNALHAGPGMHLRHLFGGGAFLGVQLTDLTPELRTHFGVPEESGVMVSKVVDDSPAAVAGLAAADIITAVGGEQVASAAALAHAVRSREAGEAVDLEIWRDGRLERLTATLDESEHAGSPSKRRRVVEVRCDDEGDCAFGGEPLRLDCPDEECEVRIECGDDGCTCTANGEERDCSEFPGVHRSR